MFNVMSLLDRIKDGLIKVIPAKSPSNNGPASMSGGIGSGGGHGMVPFEDDVSVFWPVFESFWLALGYKYAMRVRF